MISWKHSFSKLTEEYETTKKKKQALDNLLSIGRISQSTHDLFNMEIGEAITEIETQQKALLQKMNSKMMELEEQIKTLEVLLANFEIQHVTGELDEEVYQREVDALSIGLETSRNELDKIREAIGQFSSGIVVDQGTETRATEEVDVVESVEEKLQKTEMEFAEVNEANPPEAQQETLEAAEKTESTETLAEGEENQQA